MNLPREDLVYVGFQRVGIIGRVVRLGGEFVRQRIRYQTREPAQPRAYRERVVGTSKPSGISERGQLRRRSAWVQAKRSVMPAT